MGEKGTGSLFGDDSCAPALPTDYAPFRPQHFDVEQIYLAKGSLAKAERKEFVERICALYPAATPMEYLDMPHNRVEISGANPMALHKQGKKTLVFGELGAAVRFSEEQGNTCPNYWHFSPYSFCPYGCKYCYLAGTRSIWYAPAVKIFVNLPEILRKIERSADKLRKPTAFYLGKLQDALALDPLTAYSAVLVPFFARHEFARLTLLTKSAHVERLLELDHRGHTILSWSVNPPEVVSAYGENVPGIDKRLEAMKKCADRGYPILLRTVPIQRLTMGGICIYKGARQLMEAKLGRDNVISQHIDPATEAGDGRARYSQKLRTEMYAHIIRVAREVRPDLELALCLEEKPVWRTLGLEKNLGRCNCAL